MDCEDSGCVDAMGAVDAIGAVDLTSSAGGDVDCEVSGCVDAGGAYESRNLLKSSVMSFKKVSKPDS